MRPRERLRQKTARTGTPSTFAKALPEDAPPLILVSQTDWAILVKDPVPITPHILKREAIPTYAIPLIKTSRGFALREWAGNQRMDGAIEENLPDGDETEIIYLEGRGRMISAILRVGDPDVSIKTYIDGVQHDNFMPTDLDNMGLIVPSRNIPWLSEVGVYYTVIIDRETRFSKSFRMTIDNQTGGDVDLALAEIRSERFDDGKPERPVRVIGA